MKRRPTYHDAHLILDLYEARRDEKFREARDWFLHHFHAATFDEYQALCPAGSEQYAYFRMMVSYWDMVASMIATGVLEPTLFFRTGRELLFTWERIRPIVPAIRDANRDPRAWHNLEAVAQQYIAWLNDLAPNAYEQWRAGVARTRRDVDAAG
jgi:hypothetical protein